MKNFTRKNSNTGKLLFTSISSKIIALMYTAGKKEFIYFLLCLFASLPALAQKVKWEDKVDPVFHPIIAQPGMMHTPTQRHFSSHIAIKPTEGFAARNAAPERRYDCIVYTKNIKALRDNKLVINSVLPTFVTAWVTPDQILQMAAMPDVTYIEAPQSDELHNDIAVGNSGASLLHQGSLNNSIYKGKNVIVAVYDTGIDWDHLDFRYPNDTTKSRILRLWDMTLTAGTGEAPPTGYSYGVEYTQAQINDELDGSPANLVREKDKNGHGTHVAGTAAGNGAALVSKKHTGMAPEADLIIIKGSDSLFAVNRTVDAITYLQNLASTLGRPIVLNMSIGSQSGPHDGTRPHEIAIDNFTASGPGRVVVISAGNDNGTNMHNRINLAAGTTASVSFIVPDTTASDVFEYRIYANNNSNISASITAPGSDGSVAALAGQSVSGNVLSDSFTVHLENRIDPANNNRYVNVYVRRNGINTRRPTGTWTLSLTNNTTNALILDGWLHYKNRAFNATVLAGGDNDYLVSSPGNAATAITVASFTGRNNWYSNSANGGFTTTAARQDSISSFSSRGPRRDEVLKPEVAAHGQAVISTLSSDQTTVTPSDVVEPGLYRKNQGTSMASPVVAGAAALLLQANPTATATYIKNLITSTANKDALTELPDATPNTTWGYGRLDVFKAASSLFNCLPAERKAYQYDAPTRNAQESGVTFTTHRIAVRFTPDMSGKLGGVFLHTSLTATALFIEVRTNDAGSPGTLLGSVTMDSIHIARYSWNYIDLSRLNISVTDATDYFIVVGRAATSSANWSLRREAIALDNRSLQSSDGGGTWINVAFDYKIRSIVYNQAQLSGTIATANAADIKDINTSNQFITTNCTLIAQLVPDGHSPVTGTVTGKVWIEASVPHYGGSPFVARHYEITPVGASGTTGRVTLYFTQAEFNAFNADPGSFLDLPAHPADNDGKANLRVAQYPGTSSDGTGLPGSYSGTPVIIDPADSAIIWNADFGRWELSFEVVGLSGFIVQTSAIPLPVTIEYFRGNNQGSANILNWKVDCINTSALFEIQRSNDGISFNSIGTISATQNRCAQPFTFKDISPLPGNNYYRLRITESTGIVRYSSIILLQTDKLLVSTLYPSVIRKGGAVQISFAGVKGYLTITDAVGRQVYRQTLFNGVQSLSLPLHASGTYYYNIKDEKNSVKANGKLIVE